MNSELVDRIVEAVLYEGYILYPYRSTALKNRQRWNFGILAPDAASPGESVAGERSWTQTECLAAVDGKTVLNVNVRFLHLQRRQAYCLSQPVRVPEEITPDLLEPVGRIDVGERCYETWEEVAERRFTVSELHLDKLLSSPCQTGFTSQSVEMLEPLYGPGGYIPGALIRSRDQIAGTLAVSAEPAGKELVKITVTAKNSTPVDSSLCRSRDQILACSMLSTHIVLNIQQGSFISLLDVPEQYQAAAESCRNIGVWPVLAGEEGSRDCMLASPIILYDYPRIAPESAGALFDSTEIDEMLALRIRTLTDEEKLQMARADDRTRRLLERTRALSDSEFLKLHGVFREISSRKESV